MPESLFELLFKVRPVAFEDGALGFEAPRPILILAISLAIAAATTALYLRRRSSAGPRRAGLLVALRVLALTVLALALLRPVLRVSTAAAGENFLAVLIDDSRSMRLADGDSTRAARALTKFHSPDSELLARMEVRFTVRTYHFDSHASAIDPTQPLEFDGRATDLGSALARVRQDLAGVPLAGVVLVTDGADNSARYRRASPDRAAETNRAARAIGLSSAGTPGGSPRRAGDGLDEELLQFASRGVPIYTVGLGDERFVRDLELSRLEAPERVLAGSAFAVDVTITQQGYDGETVSLTAEQDGVMVASHDITFEPGQASHTERMQLEAEDAGHLIYRFEIALEEGEQVVENNAREVPLAVEDRREKILYFEGEPRFEVRFMRQAIADDDNLQLVVLLRTAEKKLLRLGVDDPLELISGFPTTREELFAYRGLVLGSVEASYFTRNQLRIIEEFVSQRGGGLLLLGGRRSFAEGGGAGTPLEDLSPLVLSQPATKFFTEVQVSATEAGSAHAALQLAGNDSASGQKWPELPPLSMRNPLVQAKPGASILLTGSPTSTADRSTDDVTSDPAAKLVVLATQRYGRGRVAAFPVQDSWLWQMHASIPLEDMTHERLWRQLLRWLVSTAPRQVELDAFTRQIAPGETVDLRAEVRDQAYLGINGADVSASITDPTGAERSVPLEWTVAEDGEYRASFIPELAGPYEIRVEAEVKGATVGSDQTRVIAADLGTEFFEAEMNAPLLRRLAEQTGGRFYTADDVNNLAKDARYTESGKTTLETVELWDMPIVLLMLLASTSAEWLLRRRWGLT